MPLRPLRLTPTYGFVKETAVRQRVVHQLSCRSCLSGPRAGVPPHYGFEKPARRQAVSFISTIKQQVAWRPYLQWRETRVSPEKQR